ncbi:hypothetical protein PIB30_070247, partial [Stylosanthes scabra]|nr:hypothetical protein [Stylosanthes scabra]
ADSDAPTSVASPAVEAPNRVAFPAWRRVHLRRHVGGGVTRNSASCAVSPSLKTPLSPHYLNLCGTNKVMASLTVLVHYNGRPIEDDSIESNLPYDGPKPKTMSIKRSCTLDMFKKSIQKKIGLKDNEAVGRMAYRIPHALDEHKWQLVDVDDDIECLFDMHAIPKVLRTMYLYVESVLGNNVDETPLGGRTVNTQSSQASAQRNSDSSTPDTSRKPIQEGNPLMKDILSDISDHEDDLLSAEDDDCDVEAAEVVFLAPNVAVAPEEAQIIAASPPSSFVPPSFQFSDIN